MSQARSFTIRMTRYQFPEMKEVPKQQILVLTVGHPLLTGYVSLWKRGVLDEAGICYQAVLEDVCAENKFNDKFLDAVRREMVMFAEIRNVEIDEYDAHIFDVSEPLKDRSEEAIKLWLRNVRTFRSTSLGVMPCIPVLVHNSGVVTPLRKDDEASVNALIARAKRSTAIPKTKKWSDGLSQEEILAKGTEGHRQDIQRLENLYRQLPSFEMKVNESLEPRIAEDCNVVAVAAIKEGQYDVALRELNKAFLVIINIMKALPPDKLFGERGSAEQEMVARVHKTLAIVFSNISSVLRDGENKNLELAKTFMKEAVHIKPYVGATAAEVEKAKEKLRGIEALIANSASSSSTSTFRPSC